MASTRILPTDDHGLAEAIRILRAGGLVAYPTDTVYGVGCHALRPDSIRQVFAAKIRSPGKPLPLLLADIGQLRSLVRTLPSTARRLAEAFWPGGLTMVLWRGERVPVEAAGGGETVAVRVPDHPVPVALARGIDAPIVGTSANLSGQPPARTAGEVYRQLAPRVGLILDGGPALGSQPSTVVDLTVDPPVVRRQGAVPVEAIERVLGQSIIIAEEE